MKQKLLQSNLITFHIKESLLSAGINDLRHTVKSRINETNFKKLQPNFIKAWITENKKHDILDSDLQKH